MQVTLTFQEAAKYAGIKAYPCRRYGCRAILYRKRVRRKLWTWICEYHRPNKGGHGGL